jgi:hypothetical protein
MLRTYPRATISIPQLSQRRWCSLRLGQRYPPADLTWRLRCPTPANSKKGAVSRWRQIEYFLAPTFDIRPIRSSKGKQALLNRAIGLRVFEAFLSSSRHVRSRFQPRLAGRLKRSPEGPPPVALWASATHRSDLRPFSSRPNPVLALYAQPRCSLFTPWMGEPGLASAHHRHFGKAEECLLLAQRRCGSWTS